MVTTKTLLELLQEHIVPLQREELQRAQQIDDLLKGPAEASILAHGKLRQNRSLLRDLSHTSLMGLIVEYSAQQIVAEGVTASQGDVSYMWEPMDRNGVPSKQGALWAAMLQYGSAYGLTLPNRETGLAYMRGFSPKTFGAIYQDAAEDDYPMWAWRQIPQRAGVSLWRIYDDSHEHFLSYEDGKYRFIESREHGLGVTPVVRFTANADLEANVVGEPLKFEIDFRRHSKTVNDRLSIQHFNSWRVKTATKLPENATPEEREQFRLKLEHDDILLGMGDTEFSTLEETSMSSMVDAQDSDRDLLAAVSQTPVWAFNGGAMVNLSADALVEAKSGNRQKVWGIQRENNRPLLNWVRLAAVAEGRHEDAMRYDLATSWADIGSQSMAAAADSLGKMAVQLGVPVEMLWELIPGVDARMVERWKDWKADHPEGDLALAAAFTRQSQADG